MIRTRTTRAPLLLLVAAWTLLGCANTAPQPPTPARLDAWEKAAARDAFLGVEKKFPPYGDERLQRYVRGVGARLVARAPHTGTAFRFTVLDSPGVFAFSFGDGNVVISRGLLIHLNSEAQLATVLAHEIGHVVSGDQARTWHEIERARDLEARLSTRLTSKSARDTVDTLSLARVRGYSRKHELEADRMSERLLAQAGFDPAAMAQVLRFFVQQDAYWTDLGFKLWELPQPGNYEGVFATHPSTAARLAQAEADLSAAARATAAADPIYLRHLRGVTYGLARRYGVQRGALYIQPARRVRFTLPQGWYLFGTDDRLMAAPRGRDGVLIFKMKDRGDAGSVHDALVRMAKPYRLESVERLAAPSVRGETGVTHFTDEGVQHALRLAVIDVGTQRLSVVGLTYATGDWAATDVHFRALLRSVRLASEAQVRTIRPLRIALTRSVGAGLAPSAFTDHAAQRLALLNQAYPSGRVAPGQWVKTVR